jgi:hypothetical protein
MMKTVVDNLTVRASPVAGTGESYTTARAHVLSRKTVDRPAAPARDLAALAGRNDDVIGSVERGHRDGRELLCDRDPRFLRIWPINQTSVMQRLVVPLEPKTGRLDLLVRNRAIAENPVDPDVSGQVAYRTFIQAVDVEDRQA